jgi:hypothetical protein
MIVVNWFDVYVQADHPDTGCVGQGFHRGDDGPGKVFSCLEKLNTALEMIDLPPLDEWEEHEDEPGQFHASKSEDGQGCAITDDEFRADPSRGLFCVDYTMSVSVAVTHALTAKDVREMMTNG